MPYPLDTEIDLIHLGCVEKYIISSHHRMRGRPHKSVWIISHDQEVLCFVDSIQNKWRDGSQAWGLFLVDNILNVLGESDDNIGLKIAKFVDGMASSVWHGYPANFMENGQDRPTSTILHNWVERGLISKATMSRIRTGKSCGL